MKKFFGIVIISAAMLSSYFTFSQSWNQIDQVNQTVVSNQLAGSGCGGSQGQISTSAFKTGCGDNYKNTAANSLATSSSGCSGNKSTSFVSNTTGGSLNKPVGFASGCGSAGFNKTAAGCAGCPSAAACGMGVNGEECQTMCSSIGNLTRINDYGRVYAFCPVRDKEFKLTRFKPFVEYYGTRYYVSSKAAMNKFNDNPSQYIANLSHANSLIANAASIDFHGTVFANCPVTNDVHGVSNPTQYVDYQGFRYYTMCGSCDSEFKANPAKYVSGACDGNKTCNTKTQMQVFDSNCRNFGNLVRVDNGQLIALCPVTKVEFAVTPTSEYYDFNDARYFFRDSQSLQSFEQNPQGYVDTPIPTVTSLAKR